VSDWTTDLRERMIDVLVKHGTLIDPSANVYGWIHPGYADIKTRIYEGQIDYARSSWTEVDWHEFMGTFYEGDTRRVGIDLTVVMCNGDRHVLRFAGTVGELIQAIVGDVGKVEIDG